MEYENCGQWITIKTGTRGMKWLDQIPQYQIESIFRAGENLGRENVAKPLLGDVLAELNNANHSQNEDDYYIIGSDVREILSKYFT